MSTPPLVQAFYERIWNGDDRAAVVELLAPGFLFRGSLGTELRGHAAFLDYVTGVRTALADFRCEILDCVAEGDRAFARMRFSGRHTGPLRGFPPSGRPVAWQGAALFRFRDGRIADLWVLGDLVGLDAMLAGTGANP